MNSKRDHLSRKSTRSSMNINGRIDEVSLSIPKLSAISMSTKILENVTSHQKQSSLDKPDAETNLVPHKLDSVNNTKEDEHKAFGHIVSETLRKLPRDMLICCRKVMNDAMFEAEMGTLNKYSKIVSEPPLHIAERKTASVQQPPKIPPSSDPQSIQKELTGQVQHLKTITNCEINNHDINLPQIMKSKNSSTKEDVIQMKIKTEWIESDPGSPAGTEEKDPLPLEVLISEDDGSNSEQEIFPDPRSRSDLYFLPDINTNRNTALPNIKGESQEEDELLLSPKEYILEPAYELSLEPSKLETELSEVASVTFEQGLAVGESELVFEDHGTTYHEDAHLVSSGHKKGEMELNNLASQVTSDGELINLCYGRHNENYGFLKEVINLYHEQHTGSENGGLLSGLTCPSLTLEQTPHLKFHPSNKSTIHKRSRTGIEIIKNNNLKKNSLSPIKVKHDTCIECGKTFNMHNMPILNDLGGKRYNCSECGKNESATEILPGSIDSPYKCEECGKTFSRKPHLNRHVFDSHSGNKPHKCDQCGKGFSRRAEMQRHVLTHTKAKPYICNQCGKPFSARQSLKNHMLTHSGEKHFKCRYCDREFNRLGNLNTHILSHTGERPYECSYCNHAFSTKQNLNRHILSFLGDNLHK